MTTRFIKTKLRGGRFHLPKQYWTRTDIVLTGQINKERAKHIALLWGAKLVSYKSVPTPKWIVKHNKKMGW
jgi:hypothetical protein